MRKSIKIILISLGILIVLLLIVGGIGFSILNKKFIDIEKGYAKEKKDFEELTIDGYTFLDRNGNGELDPYEDNRLNSKERAKDALSKMTLEEKIHLLKGSGMKSGIGWDKNGIPGAVGTIVPTPSLGLPTVYLSDGPAGLRILPTRKGEDRTYYCTAFPIGTMLASTWNESLIYEVGNAMGNEAQEYGIDVILGPGANIHRHPFCGRNFEYYSEDPLLTGWIGAAMVNGIESNEGVGTSVKHFVANNQETNRNYNDTRVSDRAMREIYLKGFEIIVKKAQPWTIMSSYNKVNGTYTSESKDLLTDILRNEWGFEGLVMSDWYGGSDAVAMISAGNDLLEPGTKKQWDALLEGAESGKLSEETIDKAALRILELVMKSGKLESQEFNNDPNLKNHAMIARESAGEGIILLKNDGCLPLKNEKNIALIGVTSYDFIAGGTGSGDVNEAYTVSLEEGLVNAGFDINSIAKSVFESHKAANKKSFRKPEGFAAMFNPYDPPEMELTMEQLVSCAEEADMAIVTIGRNSGEGGDRTIEDDFLLSKEEKDLIENTCKAFHDKGKKVIIVLNIGGVIETASWKDMPDGILLAWQGGQEGGNAASDVLTGKVNPSGKLPMTFPINIGDHATHENFPLEGGGMNLMSMFKNRKQKSTEEQLKNIDYTDYAEDIYVGYRHFDKNNTDVAFPFGYGGSYTNFNFDEASTIIIEDTIIVSVKVTNLGSVEGKEVVQVYVSKPESAVDRPSQELKGFKKTSLLAPGQSETIAIKIPFSDLAYWDETVNSWNLEKGNYEVRIGNDSRSIKATQDFNIDLP